MSKELLKTKSLRFSLSSGYAALGLAWLVVSFVVSCKSMNRIPSDDEPRIDSGWPVQKASFQEANLRRIEVAIPTIPDAEYVNDDEFCANCHETHSEAYPRNVHRKQSCEECHGPASRHLETRGKEPGLILDFKAMQPAQRSEICAKCHEENGCAPGNTWRRSVHAHQGVACTDCHHNHYNVPPGTPVVSLDTNASQALPEDWKFQLASNRAAMNASLEETEALPSLRGTSNNLGAVAPQVCYQCHGDKRELEEVAHPHQIHGPNSLNCTTCHDSHGNLLQSSRKELCLQCHDGTAPNAAWHSSTHDQVGVACTDCHNPHPSTSVQRVVNISHTSVARPKRMPMSVNEPEACYKCHPKIFGLVGLPSHHPIKQGKVTCSDCHDAHGQAEGGLTEPTVNMVCYKCHAEKQGPFVYEHPPVTENCAYCHDPHGTVANNLMRQPPAFLCLRCHTGHRVAPADHFGLGVADIDGNPGLRSAYYSDCTQCHDQIHGSDLPSQHRASALLR
jgi:DmsE family decaheme c-type cytochrome